MDGGRAHVLKANSHPVRFDRTATPAAVSVTINYQSSSSRVSSSDGDETLDVAQCRTTAHTDTALKIVPECLTADKTIIYAVEIGRTLRGKWRQDMQGASQHIVQYRTLNNLVLL